MENIEKCIECGGKPCICSGGEFEDVLWIAHCQDCDNTTGKRGYYDPTHDSKESAIAEWNTINTKP